MTQHLLSSFFLCINQKTDFWRKKNPEIWFLLCWSRRRLLFFLLFTRPVIRFFLDDEFFFVFLDPCTAFLERPCRVAELFIACPLRTDDCLREPFRTLIILNIINLRVQTNDYLHLLSFWSNHFEYNIRNERKTEVFLNECEYVCALIN